jgi:cytochrome P450 family 142 subfamily A polypeptide 1
MPTEWSLPGAIDAVRGKHVQLIAVAVRDEILTEVAQRPRRAAGARRAAVRCARMTSVTMTREFDLLDGGWYASNPHDDWAWMREHAPAYRDPKNMVWALTRYDDVLAAEKDPETFSSHRAPRPHGDHLPMMISMDAPEHSRRRKLVSRGFTPRRVRDHEATIRRICTHIIDRVAAKGECDFVWDIAAPLPLLLIADMLGFPPDAYDNLLRWSDDLIRATTIDPPPEVAQAGLEAMLEFREFQLGVIADRRARPAQDDLVSILCYADIDGERLDDESIINESLLILIGGDETSRHVMTDGMLALLEHPDQHAILRDDPDAIEIGVEELLRWVSPIKNMSRTVTREYEMHGQTMHEGDQVMLMYPSANRDSAVFDDPDRFDVRRDPNPHLAFGFGPHFCMGASLARLELKVMFGELLRRLPDLHLAGEPFPRRSSNFISGPEAMPVAFTPA